MSLRAANEFGVLRLVLDAAREEEGCSREALTVLGVRHDPYRLELDVNRAEGTWLAARIDSLYRPNSARSYPRVALRPVRRRKREKAERRNLQQFR